MYGNANSFWVIPETSTTQYFVLNGGIPRQEDYNVVDFIRRSWTE